MKEIEIEELKLLQLDILCKIDGFCRLNNIHYTLFFGTLLGAIRHKGYIPWDDDIDIAMPRPDYDRFISSFNGFYDNLYVLCPEINPNFYASYANVCDNRTILDEGRNGHRGIEMGVKIDVFPIDGTPDDEKEYLDVVQKINHLNYIMRIKRYGLKYTTLSSFVKNIIRKLAYIPCKYSSLQRKIIETVRLSPYKDAKYVDYQVYHFKKICRAPKIYFDDYLDIEFEGRTLMAIKHYDDYLHLVYGDYMKLPPLEKRVTNHTFRAYWKNN